MNEQQANQGYELDWDSAIENDSTFALLPAGEYSFVAKGFEFARHEGSQKLPPCNKGIVTLEMTGVNGEKGIITHNLFLHSTTEGMLCAFFTAIGQRKHGEKLVPRWKEIVGSSGTCTVAQTTFIKRTGEEGKSNEIKRFHEKAQPATVGAGAF